MYLFPVCLFLLFDAVRPSILSVYRASNTTVVPYYLADPAHKDPKTAYTFQTAASSINPSSRLDRTAWLIDSGASDHIACELSYFIDWKRLRTPIPIILGNQLSIQAICIGTVILRLPENHVPHSSHAPGHALNLENVLYAPGIGCNLLSVGRLTSSTSFNSYKMTFGNGACHLIDKTGVSVSSCKQIGGMYKLQCRVVDKSTFSLKATSKAT